MEGIVYIFATWGIDAHHIDSSQVHPVLELFLGNWEMLAGWGKAGIGSFAELLDLNIVLKKNGVSLGGCISHVSNSPDIVSQGKFSISRPIIEVDHDPFIFELIYVVGSD